MNAQRNDPCPCGSGKKYKKCCLDGATVRAPVPAAGALLRKALQHHRAGQLHEAEGLYSKLLEREPDHPQALHGLGLLAHRLGDHARALELIARACRALPADPMLHSDLGMVYQALGRDEDAADCYRTVLALQPGHAAWNSLGLVSYRLGWLQESEAAYREAIRFKPDQAETYVNLGNALVVLNRSDEAIPHFLRALALKPDLMLGHYNLGAAYERKDRLDEAVACYQQSIALAPNFANAYHNLGTVLVTQGRVEEAMTYFERAQSLSPDLALPYDNWLAALNYLAPVTPQAVYEAHCKYARRFELPLKPLWPAHVNSREAERRLRIGYVSPDFRLHSVAFFMEPILAHHDQRAVEVYCYYNNTRQDVVTARLQAYADHWIPCMGMTDEQLAARIQADGIDILVDLAGHTLGNRLLVFARKPAPVQITYLGYVATTGLTAMDYRMSHIDADPEGFERYNSEQIYRLPRSLWCYRPPLDMPVEVAATPARRIGHITFGAMNNIAKVSDTAVALWSRLLQALPGSRLIMAGVPLGYAQRRIFARFAGHGIAAARIELHPMLSYQSFRELHHRIDMALDSFPHNGNTTSCESLWMGVPVLSLIGDRFVARFGYLLLKGIGLAELAAHDEGEYLAIATALAQDLDRLDALRAGMRQRLAASMLRDEEGFTRDLESAYRAMWRGWCEGTRITRQ